MKICKNERDVRDILEEMFKANYLVQSRINKDLDTCIYFPMQITNTRVTQDFDGIINQELSPSFFSS